MMRILKKAPKKRFPAKINHLVAVKSQRKTKGLIQVIFRKKVKIQ